MFILVAALSYRSLLAVEQVTRMRALTRESLLQSRTLLSQLKDVETAQSGYVITGDVEYLAPYHSGLLNIPQSRKVLSQELKSLNIPSQQVEDLEALVDKRIQHAKLVVETRRQQGLNEAQLLILSKEGKSIMEAARASFDALDTRLRFEISQRNLQMDSMRRRAFWSTGFLTVLGVTLIGLGFFLMLREQQRRIKAEADLNNANVRLEEAVAKRTAELEQARVEIETFARQLDISIESERRRLSREVHDQLGQIYTALKMSLGQILSDSAVSVEERDRINSLLKEGIATVRRIASELRPPLLDDLGLGAALEAKAKRFLDQTGLPCEVKVEQSQLLRPEQATQLYRIAQEALTNVARHAGASQIWIEDGVLDGQYAFIIEDNGHGMKNAPAGSIGLLSMRERAALSGGKLELESGRAGGVRIRVMLPLKENSGRSHADTDC